MLRPAGDHVNSSWATPARAFLPTTAAHRGFHRVRTARPHARGHRDRARPGARAGQAHGGAVAADSEPKRGTTFRVAILRHASPRIVSVPSARWRRWRLVPGPTSGGRARAPGRQAELAPSPAVALATRAHVLWLTTTPACANISAGCYAPEGHSVVRTGRAQAARDWCDDDDGVSTGSSCSMRCGPTYRSVPCILLSARPVRSHGSRGSKPAPTTTWSSLFPRAN